MFSQSHDGIDTTFKIIHITPFPTIFFCLQTQDHRDKKIKTLILFKAICLSNIVIAVCIKNRIITVEAKFLLKAARSTPSDNLGMCHRKAPVQVSSVGHYI